MNGEAESVERGLKVVEVVVGNHADGSRNVLLGTQAAEQNAVDVTLAASSYMRLFEGPDQPEGDERGRRFDRGAHPHGRSGINLLPESDQAICEAEIAIHGAEVSYLESLERSVENSGFRAFFGYVRGK